MRPVDETELRNRLALEQEAKLAAAEARIAELEREREGHVETCIQLNKQLREFAIRIAELEAAQAAR